MVEFMDGSVLAQLGLTDMRIAIQYALTYPERWDSPLPSLDIYQLPKLEFFEPDLEKFPCLRLAYRALRAGGTAPAALNAANEVAVEAFLNNGIAYQEIPQIIESVLDAHSPQRGHRPGNRAEGRHLGPGGSQGLLPVRDAGDLQMIPDSRFEIPEKSQYRI